MRGDGYWGVMVSHLRGVSVHGDRGASLQALSHAAGRDLT
jgi:hypothetical protein